MSNTKIKILFLKLILIVIILNTNTRQALAADSKPNIVFILTDDQRLDTVKKYMPTTYNEIFLKGTTFTNHYATTPICGPSRISIMTGLYTSEHGMLYNESKEKSTLHQYSIAKALKDSGYYTGMVGKFHNTSDGRYSEKRRQEYDYWVAQRGGSARYTDLVINENGKFSRKRSIYVTEYWNRKALQFLDKAKKKHKPFFLTLSHNAPHSPALPTKAYRTRYNEREVPSVPSFLDMNDTGKPSWVNMKKQNFARSAALYKSKAKNIKLFAAKQLATLMSVDNGVKQIIKKLKKLKLYDNTVLIFMSDNGLMWGEHCLQSKNNIYEESAKIPLAMAYKKDPTMFPVMNINEMTANIDMAPTFAHIAGIAKEKYENRVSGISLLDVINGNSEREGIILQGSWNDKLTIYNAFHTKEFIYSETGYPIFEELYDVKTDNYELKNVADAPSFEEIKEDLKAKLHEELEIHDPNECYKKFCSDSVFK